MDARNIRKLTPGGSPLGALLQVYLLSAWRIFRFYLKKPWTLVLGITLVLLLLNPGWLLNRKDSTWSGAVIMGVITSAALRSAKPLLFKDHAFLSLLLAPGPRRLIWLLKSGVLHGGLHALPFYVFYREPRKLISYGVTFAVYVGLDNFMKYLQTRRDRRHRRSETTSLADAMNHLPVHPQALALLRRDWLQLTADMLMIFGAVTLFIMIMMGPLSAVYLQRDSTSSIWSLLFIVPTYLFLWTATEIMDRSFLSQIQESWQIRQRQGDLLGLLQSLVPNILLALALAGLFLKNWPSPWQCLSFILIALMLSVVGGYLVGTLRLRFPGQVLKRLLLLGLFMAMPVLIPIVIYVWRPRSHARHS
ncbi:hypothetical protein [Oligoflexus tunisiensis]|uniref:hypothetical protein n=1 Tax=Oligoflexus tunisiensis TaxID=708132 RepID=UPI00114CDEF9|nr:hypothetical protein [Oligoflexus tunisiensis]